jgi:Flp pilus assembly pilin Flp
MTTHTRHSQSGASSAEYGLLISLIAAAIVVTLVFFGTEVSALFDEPCDSLTAAGRPC